MEISHYLAMTAAEIAQESDLPRKLAYMACHFSPYATGISNIPDTLPPSSMLILNDRMPICGHDPERITEQLCRTVDALRCDSVLLDFQRSDQSETATLCEKLVQSLPCQTAVSHLYAASLSCPVFLPPPTLDQQLEAHLKPWSDRPIWLEAALEQICITVSPQGSCYQALIYDPLTEEPFIDEALCCCYRTEVLSNEIRFHLKRTPSQLKILLDRAQALGIEKTVGLYQQLGKV